SSASSASGKSSKPSLPFGAAAPAAATLGAEKASAPSPRPDNRMSSRPLISVVYRVCPSRSCHERYSILPSTYTLSPFLQKRSAISARVENLVFQNTTRCHSVFSCFSPAWFFHCRLVAIERVATREPLAVLRTSGSAPRFPIKMALFRLRLTGTSKVQQRPTQV